MLLRKTLNLSDVNLKMEGAAGRFSGYASVFNVKDAHGDVIAKGAFTETLRTNGLPKMFFNHGWSMPIGKYLVAEEDEKGLFVEGELTPGLSMSADVGAAMKHQTLDGLSIGGLIKKGDYDETEDGRTINKWAVLLEVSPTVFPANRAARIDLASIKGAGDDLDAEIAAIESLREFERFLRDAGGLSKGAVQALTARAKTLFTERDAGAEVEVKAFGEIAARLERMQAIGA